MSSSNNRNAVVQSHTLNAPALKSILMAESGIEAKSVNDHIDAIQQRKRQELNDYLLVCKQRLKSVIDPVRDIDDIHKGHGRVYSIMKRTCKSWCN